MARNSTAMNSIESSVTHLLVATKQLLESLTQWARGAASEQDVSDIYVNLGNEFNIACRAFLNAGLPVTDMGDVPQALRTVLEKALSEEASQENLDLYLPSIREIIINLLQGLKKKQAALRAAQGAQTQQTPPQQSPKFRPQPPQHQYGPSRQVSAPTSMPQHKDDRDHVRRSQTIGSAPMQPGLPSPPVARQAPQPPHMAPPSHMPPAVPGAMAMPPAIPQGSPTRRPGSRGDPLAALQRGEALERRASRRFSAYQYAKLTSGTPGKAVPDMPMLPSTPLPDETVADVTTATEIGAGLSLFLRLGNSTKKVKSDSADLNINALRLLFISTFNYSPGADDFPSIYIRDSASGVEYELEETHLGEIHEGTMLVLHEEEEKEKEKEKSDDLQGILEHVKAITFALNQQREEIGDLKLMVEKKPVAPSASGPSVVKATEPVVKTPVIAPPEVSQPKLSTIVAAPAPAPIADKALLKAKAADMHALKHELAVIRQLKDSSFTLWKTSMKDISDTIGKLRDYSSLPAAGDNSRAFMEMANKKVSTDSDALLTRADDLQDVIEALRKDVAQRGVRAEPGQLVVVTKEMETCNTELTALETYINSQKSVWKKVWERELETICEEQQFFKLQEELMADLREDLASAASTLALVEQCSNEQLKSAAKNSHKTVLLPVPTESVQDLKEGVLSSVLALKPDHESRIEAIERSERLRKFELESRVDKFEKELGEFVGENKLKPSGGVAEAEKQRLEREQRVWREQFGYGGEEDDIDDLDGELQTASEEESEEEESEEESEEEEEEDEEGTK
ncbi:Bud site selection protein 6 [Yarrowia sp. B02]|nr:Bud site selection protein 6 [Yarrowia sp. B02]